MFKHVQTLGLFVFYFFPNDIESDSVAKGQFLPTAMYQHRQFWNDNEDIQQLCTQCTVHRAQANGKMGTGYYHGQWFCAVCWAAWRVHNRRRHGHEGRHDEQQSNGNNDSLEHLVSDIVQPILVMLRVSRRRMDEMALRQDEMKKALTQITQITHIAFDVD